MKLLPVEQLKDKSSVRLPLAAKLAKALMRYDSVVLKNVMFGGYEVPPEMFKLIPKVSNWEKVLEEVISARERLEEDYETWTIDLNLLRGVPEKCEHFQRAREIFIRKIEILELSEVQTEVLIEDGPFQEIAASVYERMIAARVRTIFKRMVNELEDEGIGLDGIIVLKSNASRSDITRRILEKIYGKENINTRNLQNKKLKMMIYKLAKKNPAYFEKLYKDPMSLVLRDDSDKKKKKHSLLSMGQRTQRDRGKGPTKMGIEKVVSNFYSAIRS